MAIRYLLDSPVAISYNLRAFQILQIIKDHENLKIDIRWVRTQNSGARHETDILTLTGQDVLLFESKQDTFQTAGDTARDAEVKAAIEMVVLKENVPSGGFQVV